MKNIWTLAKRDVAVQLNAPATYIAFVLFLLMTGWFFAGPLFVVDLSTLDSFSSPIAFLFTFLMPALTMRAFAEESRSGTFEVLATLPLQDREIVLGKYAAVMALLAALLSFTLAYPMILAMIGRPDPAHVLGTYLAILGLGSFFGAVGLWASSLTRNQVVAFIIGFFTCFVFYSIHRVADFFPKTLAVLLRSLSVEEHIGALARGVIDGRDLLYWFSTTIFFLASALTVLHSRRFTEQRANRRRMRWASVGGMVLLAFILLLGNALASAVSWRADLSQGRLYSLSKASRQLVRDLPDPILIRAYFSADLPPPYNTFERYTHDLLSEYQSASHGRIRFEFILPFPMQEFERRAAQARLAPLQFEEMGADQMSIRRAFMGLVMFHRDKSEVIPVVQDPQALEYELTSRFARMLDRPKKTVAVIQGHGELPWAGQKPAAAQDLDDLFQFTAVSLPDATTAPIKADAVLVIGPRQKYDAASFAALDHLLQAGTPVGVFVDEKFFQAQTFTLNPLETGFRAWLSTWGVDLGNQLVLDRQAEAVEMMQRVGNMAIRSQVRYPFMPLAIPVSKDHPITRALAAVSLPFVTRVERSSAPPAGLTYTPLLQSSPLSWLAPPQVYTAVPDKIPPPQAGQPTGPFTLAMEVEGQNPPRRLVVVGTSNFLNPQMPPSTGARAFLMNLLGTLTRDEALLGIRPKGDILRPLKPVKPALREVIKIIAVLGVPVFAALWGLLRWRRRLAWRARVSAAYKKS